jgi:hypothetical protein
MLPLLEKYLGYRWIAYGLLLIGMVARLHAPGRSDHAMDPARVLASGQGSYLPCGGETIDLGPLLVRFADSLLALDLPYSHARATDCSGIFIRFNEFLGRHCPTTDFPTLAQVRSTRDLLGYYHARQQLVLIKDPSASDSLLQPGTIMFYTHGNRGGQLRITPDNMTSLVSHVGIVYAVERDTSTGRVLRYELFHARNQQYGIDITGHHRREPAGAQAAYPYGNGRQQWMAAAPLALPVP